MSRPVDPSKEFGNELADEDSLFVCCACGKTSEDQYGSIGVHTPGWDESCMMNCQEFKKAHLVFSPGGRVIEVRVPAPEPAPGTQ